PGRSAEKRAGTPGRRRDGASAIRLRRPNSRRLPTHRRHPMMKKKKRPPPKGHYTPPEGLGTGGETAPAVGDPNLRFKVSHLPGAERYEPDGVCSVSHNVLDPHVFFNTHPVSGGKFKVKSGGVHFEAVVVADVAIPKEANLTGWTVGYVQN